QLRRITKSAQHKHPPPVSGKIATSFPYPLLPMPNTFDLQQLATDIKRWGRELGFQQLGITDTQLSDHEARLKEWLNKGYHGSMGWLAAHGNRRSRPAELVPGTVRVISVRMDYLPGDTQQIHIL